MNITIHDIIIIMDQEILNKLNEQDKKLDEIYRSSEKIRKYFLRILVITVAMIILPAIGMIFAIPNFLRIYTSGFGI